ncbi:hypothetical protein EYR36_001914 [Pleurotus pulmonarius]|nr:hypothetical protein EYR36_001914 [Pleurotus pulmonarius]
MQTPRRVRSLPPGWTIDIRRRTSVVTEKPPMRPISKDDIIIAVMGPTGAGKSSFINTATNSSEAMVGHNLESCTQEVRAISCPHPESGRNVVLVDTPGFDDTVRTDTDILSAIANWLSTTYRDKITLSGILYLHRISDNRMAGTPIKNLNMFKQLCGQDALDNVILMSTMWTEVAEDVGEGRELELQRNYWKPMIVAGSRTTRFDGSHQRAWEIIDALGPGSKPLLIQTEMVDEGKTLPETSAGTVLLRWLGEFIREIRDLIRRIDAQLRGIPKEDTQSLTTKQEEKDALVHELNEVSTKRANLESNRRGLRRRFSMAMHTIRTPSPTGLTPRSTILAERLPNVMTQEDESNVWLPVVLAALRHARDIAEIPPVPFLKGACRIAFTIAEAANSLKTHGNAFQAILQNSSELLSTIVKQAAAGELSGDAKETVEKLARELERVQPVVHKALARNSLQRYFLDVAEEQLLKDCEQRILQAYRLFQVRSMVNLQQAVSRIEAQLAVVAFEPAFKAIPSAPHIHRCCSPEPLPSSVE